MSDNTTVRGWLRRRYEACRRRSARLAPEVQTNLWDMTRVLDAQQFAVLGTAPVSMLPAERLLLYTLIFGVRPQRYLEVGTLFGGSAAIVCAALDVLDLDTRMILVDPEPKIDPSLWAHLQRRATLVRGYSPASLREAADAAGGRFDFVLIDGDHSQEGTLRDLDGVLPFCLDGAYILCHDCFFPTVTQAVDEFACRHASRVVDFGPLTRDTSAAADANGNTSAEHPARWGGIRVLQVRA
jgi:predicted O-methyltransferase YrrM